MILTATASAFAATEVTVTKRWNDSLDGEDAESRSAPTVNIEGETSYEQLLNLFYPVGCYFETTDETFDPNTAWGGTWVEDDGGRVHVAAGSNTANTVTTYGSLSANTATFTTGDKGGEFEHTLTINEMPSHNHTFRDNMVTYSTGNATTTGQFSYGTNTFTYRTASSGTATTGNDESHNNMMPYTVVKRWHRTA